MKKKLVSMVLSLAMVAAVVTGCGNDGASAPASTDTTATADTTTDAAADTTTDAAADTTTDAAADTTTDAAADTTTDAADTSASGPERVRLSYSE